MTAPQEDRFRFDPDDDDARESLEEWKRAFAAFHPGQPVPEPSHVEMLHWFWAHMTPAEQRKFARTHTVAIERVMDQLRSAAEEVA
jgi:hypothetical protein